MLLLSDVVLPEEMPSCELGMVLAALAAAREPEHDALNELRKLAASVDSSEFVQQLSDAAELRETAIWRLTSALLMVIYR